METIARKSKSLLGFTKRECKEFDDLYITKRLYVVLITPALEYISVIGATLMQLNRCKEVLPSLHSVF